MPRSVFHTETKTAQWPVGLADCPKLRIQPTVEAILEEYTPASVGKGEYSILSGIKVGLIADILAERWSVVYRTLGRLFPGYGTSGMPASKGRGDSTDEKSLPNREVQCPHCGLHFVAQDEPRRDERA